MLGCQRDAEAAHRAGSLVPKALQAPKQKRNAEKIGADAVQTRKRPAKKRG